MAVLTSVQGSIAAIRKVNSNVKSSACALYLYERIRPNLLRAYRPSVREKHEWMFLSDEGPTLETLDVIYQTQGRGFHQDIQVFDIASQTNQYFKRKSR